MYFVTSDTHFNHKNIILYSNRPYESTDEMNADLIHKWNSVVKKGDTIFHLGDVAMGNLSKLSRIVEQLNGNIILIRGNHDPNKVCSLFKYVANELYLKHDNEIIWFNHFPLGEKDYKGRSYCERPVANYKYTVALNGHSHDGLFWNGQSLNIGVDQWSMSPISLDHAIDCFNDLKANYKDKRIKHRKDLHGIS